MVEGRKHALRYMAIVSVAIYVGIACVAEVPVPTLSALDHRAAALSRGRRLWHDRCGGLRARLAAGVNLPVRLWVMSEFMPVGEREIASILVHPPVACAVTAPVVVAVDGALAPAAVASWARLAADVAVGAPVHASLALVTMRHEVDAGLRQLK